MGSQYTVDPGLTESRSSAPVGYVTLDPGIRKVKFVTKKLDNQTQIHVLLSNITSYDGSCSSGENGPLLSPWQSGCAIGGYDGWGVGVGGNTSIMMD